MTELSRSQVLLSQEHLAAIVRHGESAYPDEGCGFILGRETGGVRQVVEVLPLSNSRDAEARHNRFLITPADSLLAERTAQARGLDVLGVFHSHPDHPARPSEYDRAHAFPWWSYLITSVQAGKGTETRSWLLADDRSRFDEQGIMISEEASNR